MCQGCGPTRGPAGEFTASARIYGPLCHDAPVRQLYRSPRHELAVRRWCLDRLERWTTPHSTSVLDTSLGPTHLTRLGAGADTCLYLPGTNFNAATSTDLLDLLAQQCTVLCADLPGQPGLSAATRPRDEVRGYARWAGEVLAAVCGTGRTVLAGHSRGAAMALTAPPDAVDALLLVSPAGLAKVRLTATLLARTLPWLLRPDADRSARMVELMAGEPMTDHQHLTEWMTLIARSTRTTGAPGPLPDDTLARWHAHPARVLVGERDVFFPPSRLEGRSRRHLRVTTDVVPGAGHLLIDQRPDVVARAVGEVLVSARRDPAP